MEKERGNWEIERKGERRRVKESMARIWVCPIAPFACLACLPASLSLSPGRESEKEREREREQVKKKEAVSQSTSLCRVRWGGAWDVVRV